MSKKNPNRDVARTLQKTAVVHSACVNEAKID